MDDQRIGILLAAGGERVIAWETGVVAGLLDEGFDARRAAVIAGTSAGALVAARLALGSDPRADLERLQRVRMRASAPTANGAELVAAAMSVWNSSRELGIGERRRQLGELALGAPTRGEDDYVRGIGAQLPAGEWPASLRLAAVDAYSGARVLVDASQGVSVARGVAAARAVPGLRPAVSLNGYALIDAALGTATNADMLCADVDRVVIVTAAPAQAAQGTLDGEFAAGLERERRSLERIGVDVVVMHATEADRVAMGDELFSAARAERAAAAGRERGRQLAANAMTTKRRSR